MRTRWAKLGVWAFLGLSLTGAFVVLLSTDLLGWEVSLAFLGLLVAAVGGFWLEHNGDRDEVTALARTAFLSFGVPSLFTILFYLRSLWTGESASWAIALAAFLVLVASIAGWSLYNAKTTSYRWEGPGKPDQWYLPVTIVAGVLFLLANQGSPFSFLGVATIFVVPSTVRLFRAIQTGVLISGVPPASSLAWASLSHFRDSFRSLSSSLLFIVFGINVPFLLYLLRGLETDYYQLGSVVSAGALPVFYLALGGFWFLNGVQSREPRSTNGLAGLSGAGFAFVVSAMFALSSLALLVVLSISEPAIATLDEGWATVQAVTTAMASGSLQVWSWGPASALAISVLLGLLLGSGGSPSKRIDALVLNLLMFSSLAGCVEFMVVMGSLDGVDTAIEVGSRLSPMVQSLGGGLIIALVLVGAKLCLPQTRISNPVPYQVNPGSRLGSLVSLILNLSLLTIGLVLEGADLLVVGFVAMIGGVVSFVWSRRRQRLERALTEKTVLLEEKIAENEQLLLNILPEPIALRLKSGETTIADSFPAVSVLFADIVGFTVLSKGLPSEKVVAMLDELFRAIDVEARRIGIEKIKTIGDCYMAVAGVPEPCDDHADRAIQLGKTILACVQTYNRVHHTALQIRVGINSGPVVAGVIGHHKYIYDLWGDAVNTASRMESHGTPGSIMCTEDTRMALVSCVRLRDNGVKEIKGKGPMQTWLVEP